MSNREWRYCAGDEQKFPVVRESVLITTGGDRPEVAVDHFDPKQTNGRAYGYAVGDFLNRPLMAARAWPLSILKLDRPERL